jgi:hypothetical protein
MYWLAGQFLGVLAGQLLEVLAGQLLEVLAGKCGWLENKYRFMYDFISAITTIIFSY